MNRNPYVTHTRALLDTAKMAGWIRGSYWGEWQTEAQITRALHNSTVFGLLLRSPVLEQVGFASIVSDHAAFSAITAVYVDEPHRGTGLGKVLMESVVAHPSVAKTICVLTTRVPAFYAKFGFVACGTDGAATWMKRGPG